jgi:chemotaxis protein CheD
VKPEQEPAPRRVHREGAEVEGYHPGTRQAYYLLPGQFLLAQKPTAVKTILGSCVSVCLWDATRRLGGMNHFLLPQGDQTADPVGRFGNLAIPRLIGEMLRHGASSENLRAKLFGGAAILSHPPSRTCSIGRMNVELAHKLLALAKIPLLGGDTGGHRGRKLVFHTDDGSAFIWRL